MTDLAVEPVIRIEQHERRAIVETNLADRVEFPLADPTRLLGAATRFARGVENARPIGTPVAWEEASKFLTTVHELALHCFNESKGASVDYSRLAQAVRAIQEQLAQVRSISRPAATEIITMGGQFLPWEWLGGLNDDLTSPDQACANLLGLATTCSRRAISSSETAAGSYLESQPLQLRLFRNVELKATRREVSFFRLRSDEFDLIGPIPESDTEEDLALAEHLYNPRRPYRGISPRSSDQIVHIACHHQLSEDYTINDVLSLPFLDSVIKLGPEQRHWVRARDLDNQLARLAIRMRGPRRPGPLVFFNACRGEFHPHAATSVARILLDNGSRGVVSTVVNVPDRVAAKFSRLFYEQLLDGDTVAEALREAKIKLLTRDPGSPLGMLYVYTGQPNLRLSAPTQRAR